MNSHIVKHKSSLEKKIIHTAVRLSNRCDWLTEMKGNTLKVEVVH